MSGPKTSHVVVGLVLAGALGGLFVGTRATRVSSQARKQTLFERAHGPDWVADTDGPVSPAVTWGELPSARRGPNAAFVNHLGNLPNVAPPSETSDGRAERWAESRDERASRRAYDGAPPRVPHAIDERGTATCLACHTDGVVVTAPDSAGLGGHVAPRMSHRVFANCTQCHVPESKPAVERAASPSDNVFVGMLPQAGPRYLPNSPPVMPHARFMRENCASCHGPLGAPGLRTTHPERQSCEQCHAPGPSAAQEVFFP